MKVRVWLSKLLVKMLMVVLPLKVAEGTMEDYVREIRRNRAKMSSGDMSEVTKIIYLFDGRGYEISVVYTENGLYADGRMLNATRFESLLNIIILEVFRVKTLNYIKMELGIF